MRAIKGAAFWICSQRSWTPKRPPRERDVQRTLLEAAKLPDAYEIQDEIPYRRFFDGKPPVDVFGKGSQLDFAIRRKNKETNKYKTVVACELKLMPVSPERFDKDLRRLAALKERHPYIRTYLVVFSYGRPDAPPDRGRYPKGRYNTVPDTIFQRCNLVREFSITTSDANPKSEVHLFVFEVHGVSMI
ncbi:hypothetical protein U0E10_30145 [Burkholderia ubonensis]|uniref:hypothetical protein n=1 Tax=Burkholderia ubonensis TaxID=101571 RepID=UPI002AB34105|nr:hypothetical protein [Burkholderia ubonensis]MDY7792162.1 hypothetical protein [Burkholderia ubonensis]